MNTDDAWIDTLIDDVIDQEPYEGAKIHAKQAIQKQLKRAELRGRLDEAEACDDLILNTGPYARKLIKDRIVNLEAELSKDQEGED